MPESSDRDLINDIQRVGKNLGRKRLSCQEYLQNGGRYSYYQVWDGGRTWSDVCKAAGFTPKTKQPVPDEIYFQRLARAYEELGRYHKTSERKKFGLNFSNRRFPNFTAFIERAVELGIVPRRDSSDTDPRPPPHAHEEDQSVLDTPSSTPVTSMTEDRPVPPIPAQTRRQKWERTQLDGFPYAPQDESGVVAVFAIFCAISEINWQIVEVNGGNGVDAKCYDHDMNREITVELKYTLSQASWNHSVDEIDFVVCWENRWKDFPKPVIELRRMLSRSRKGT